MTIPTHTVNLLDESCIENIISNYQFDLRPLALVNKGLNLQVAKYVLKQFEYLALFDCLKKLSPELSDPLGFFLPRKIKDMQGQNNLTTLQKLLIEFSLLKYCQPNKYRQAIIKVLLDTPKDELENLIPFYTGYRLACGANKDMDLLVKLIPTVGKLGGRGHLLSNDIAPLSTLTDSQYARQILRELAVPIKYPKKPLCVTKLEDIEEFIHFFHKKVHTITDTDQNEKRKICESIIHRLPLDTEASDLVLSTLRILALLS